ncbi:MAG: Fic family protein [Sulfurimonas sp.]|nr:Fic family protein [Sulfurimonas sp.]
MKNKILAKALNSLKKIQDREGTVFKSEKLDAKSITILIENGYLFQIVKGWHCIQSPTTQAGDSTIWYMNAWSFFAKYLTDRFGKNGYCLNPHDSLLLHTEKNSIPKQLTVILKKGVSSSKTELPDDMTLFAYEDKNNFPTNIDKKRGVNIFTIEDALCKSDTNSFINYPLEMEIALKSIRDVSTIIESLVSLKRMDTSAARLSGAYEYLGREKDAKNIKNTYHTIIGTKVNSFNPFNSEKPIFSNTQLIKSPYSARVDELCTKYASVIDEQYSNLKSKQINIENLLSELNEKYTQDAYHSLSIEGYKVTTELIEKMKNGNWNPVQNIEDKETRDALAAKGYYEAFEELKSNILTYLTSKEHIEDNIQDLQSKLYRKLFLPSVQANILKAKDLIGYRNSAIYLRGSEHVPPPKEAVLDSMDKYFEMIQADDNILSKAILGHFIFGYIHPYIDGNGRISRFIMNAILVSHGQPWVIIEKEERKIYMHALEQASNHNNIIPFAKFISQKIEDAKV